MFCARCGNELPAGAGFCSSCGTRVAATVDVAVAGVPTRPTIVTVLAVLQLIGGAFWSLGVVAVLIAFVTGGQTGPGIAGLLVGLGIVGALAAAQLVCGFGLLRLKPIGRTLQLVFAGIGLLGFPIGTIVAILILVYLNKPGIKLLFSGRDPSTFDAAELGEIETATSMPIGATIVTAVVVVILAVGGVAVIAAIAVPGLLRARMSGNEASAIASLRAIVRAEATYSASCGASGYAATLEDLGKAPAGGQPFINPDLAASGVVKSGYRITLTPSAAPGATRIAAASATCNGAASDPVSGFFATAEPVTPGSSGTRYFAVSEAGAIFTSDRPIGNPIVSSPTVTPVQ